MLVTNTYLTDVKGKASEYHSNWVYEEFLHNLYQLQYKEPKKAVKKLRLLKYAISTFNPLPGAVNVLTEAQIFSISNEILKLKKRTVTSVQTIASSCLCCSTTNITQTSTGSANIIYEKERFTVGAEGDMLTSPTEVTLVKKNIIRNSVRVILVGQGELDEYEIGSAPAYLAVNVNYDNTPVLVTFSQQPNPEERYIIRYERKGDGASSGGSGSGTALPSTTGHDGETLFTDGLGNTYWGRASYHLTKTDFQPDGITYLNGDLADNKCRVFLNDLGRFLLENRGEITYINEGGFTVNLAGFNTYPDFDIFVYPTGKNDSNAIP